MSVGTTALSHLKLASNRTCRENCCAEGLPVTFEGHGYHDFTDYACYKCMWVMLCTDRHTLSVLMLSPAMQACVLQQFFALTVAPLFSFLNKVMFEVWSVWVCTVPSATLFIRVSRHKCVTYIKTLHWTLSDVLLCCNIRGLHTVFLHMLYTTSSLTNLLVPQVNWWSARQFPTIRYAAVSLYFCCRLSFFKSEYMSSLYIIKFPSWCLDCQGVTVVLCSTRTMM